MIADNYALYLSVNDMSANHLGTLLVATHPDLYAFLGILDGLNAFEYDWSIPMLLQKLDIFPTVAERRKHSTRPFCRS